MIEPGTLYLIPTTLGKTPENNTIPEYNLRIIRSLSLFAVENIQTARTFLQWVGDTVPEYEIQFHELTKHTQGDELWPILEPLMAGQSLGVLSEAGCPGVADPGARLVELAHQSSVTVVPLVGPNSMIMALMASGCTGQSFRFSGYLPRNQHKRIEQIRQLEMDSTKLGQSELFMEAPHRNLELFNDLLNTLKDDTKVCVASSITLPDEFIKTRMIYEWKQHQLHDEIDRKPCMFILEAPYAAPPPPGNFKKGKSRKVNRF